MNLEEFGAIFSKNWSKFLQIISKFKLLMRNKIVIFTQFQSFNKHHLKYLNEIFNNLIKLNIDPIFPIIRNRTAPNTFYITLVPENNKIDITSIYESYADNISDVELIRGF